MSPDSKLQTAIAKTRDFYAMKKGAPLLQHEFGYYVADRWIAEGHIKHESELHGLCNLDEKGIYYFYKAGMCEGEFCPRFDIKILEDRGEYELVQDYAGRHVLYFKGRRNGFMPEYVDHPVKDQDTWERNVKWRLDPKSPDRFDAEHMQHIQDVCDMGKQGAMVGQFSVGGYMYLRALVGPEDLLYMFYDNPALIHDMMRTWFELTDYVTARHQEYSDLDELFLSDDICYNHGPLISPDMMREFLFPYYQQLITNTKNRQKDKTRFMHIQIDTDGDCRPVIPVYQEIGANYLAPMEVASGCDVVAIRKQYPELLMRGGIDKRELAKGKEAIDRMLDRILPFMKEHGGYIPMCDHAVPEEVNFEDYVYYRQRMQEYAG